MTAAATDPTQEVRKTLGVGAPSILRRVLRWLFIVAILAGAVFAFRVWRSRTATQGPTYESAEVKRADVQVTVRATGTLQAMTTVEVGSEVTGKVLTMRVDANDLVTKGQLLAEIDPEQLIAARDQSAAQVSSAEASIRLAKATVTEAGLALARSLRLKSDGLIGQSELDSAVAVKERADANLVSAQASATLARAALKSSTTRLDRAKIVSPIDGLVLSRLVEPGQTVTAGFATPVLFKLAQDLTKMRLNVDVDEADVARVRDGLLADFSVEAYPEKKFASRVISLRNEPKTSQNVVTYQAVLSVDNAAKLLRPGMTCTATIISEVRKDVLVVPNAALRFSPPAGKKSGPPDKKVESRNVEIDKKQRVWVLRNNIPTSIEVRAGVSDGLVTEVLSGELPVGTMVLVDVKELP